MERGKLDQEYAFNIRILVSVTGFDYLSSGLPTLFTRSVLFKMFNRLTGLKKKNQKQVNKRFAVEYFSTNATH